MGLDSLTPLVYLASRWAGTLSQALNSRTLAKAGGVTGQESGQWSGWWPRWEEAPWWIRGWFIQTEARRQDVELEKDPGLMISSESTGPSRHQSGPRRHQPTPISLSSYMCRCRLFSLACTGPVTWSTLTNRLPRRHSGQESTCQCRRCQRCRFDPWAGKIPWSRKWQPTPGFLPGDFNGQRSLAGYGPWGCVELGMVEGLSSHTHTHTHTPWLM